MSAENRKLYEEIAFAFVARQSCIQTENLDWKEKHEERLEQLCFWLPSGSGFDSGTTLDLERSSIDRLIFQTSYHHMNEHGYYDGWTEHEVWVKPHLLFGIDVIVKGRDRNGIKEYIGEYFADILTSSMEHKEAHTPA